MVQNVRVHGFSRTVRNYRHYTNQLVSLQTCKVQKLNDHFNVFKNKFVVKFSFFRQHFNLLQFYA